MGRINKTNKSNPVSADEFIIYDSEDTTDDKNVTLGQIASFTESQDSTVSGDKTFSGGCAFGSGLITYGQYTPFPTGYGAYVASYVSPTYGARLLGYDGTAYQDLSIGSMPTAGTISLKSLANGDCNFGYNVTVAEDLNVTGDIVSIGNSTAAKFIGDGSELTGTNKISFALNSGQVDASGNADLLAGTTSTTLSFKVDDGTTYKPLQVTYADGSQEVLTSLTSITGLSTNGSYEVLKIKGQNPITVATSAQFSVTQGKTFPVAPVDGDYHCLTATGLQTYKRVSGEWVETQYVKIGGCIVASNVILSVYNENYNQNGYDVNANTPLKFNNKNVSQIGVITKNGIDYPLIKQWGTIIEGAVTFPVAFPNACISVMAIGGDGGNVATWMSGALSKTGCVIHLGPADGGGPWISWEATGY